MLASPFWERGRRTVRRCSTGPRRGPYTTGRERIAWASDLPAPFDAPRYHPTCTSRFSDGPPPPLVSSTIKMHPSRLHDWSIPMHYTTTNLVGTTTPPQILDPSASFRTYRLADSDALYYGQPLIIIIVHVHPGDKSTQPVES